MVSQQSVSETAGASAGYAALLQSAGLIDEADRVVIRVTGEQAAEMLHGLTTNDVTGLSPGQGTYAFMLTPKGRVVAEMRLIRLTDEVWLDLPASCGDSALSHLRKYLPPIFAVFEQTDHRRIGVVGPVALEVLDFWADQPMSSDLKALQSSPLERNGFHAHVIGREAIEGPGFDVYVTADSYGETLGSLEAATLEFGGAKADQADWDILRVERGIPVWGPDFSENELAQEVAQDDRAISFEKGCYTGQEVVARIHFRGHVNRILRGFSLPRPDLAPGQPLYEGDRERGALGSVVVSPRLGPIALGLARAELPPGSRLALEPSGDPFVELTELPFPASAESQT
jgi:folate-binding protein YgfZ